MHVPNALPQSPMPPRTQPVRPPTFSPRSSYMPATMLPGFFVNSEADINASDVPNDGSISVFPYRDLSRIVIKQWSGPSTLESATYVLSNSAPLPPPPPPAEPQVSNQDTSEQESMLFKGFEQLNTSLSTAFTQLEATLGSINKNLEQLNGRFIDGEGRG